MNQLVAGCNVVLALGLAGLGQSSQSRPSRVFAQLGFTSQQVAAVDEGRPVARVLSWGGPSEIYVSGAVYINASPDTYLAMVRASLEKALLSIKRTAEHSAPAPTSQR